MSDPAAVVAGLHVVEGRLRAVLMTDAAKMVRTAIAHIESAARAVPIAEWYLNQSAAEQAVAEPELRWRKKPVVVEAVQLTPDSAPHFHEAPDTAVLCVPPSEVPDGLEEGEVIVCVDGNNRVTGAWIGTLEGVHRASLNDWIITGVRGERYACKPDIFAATYEPASQPPADEPARQGEDRETWQEAEDAIMHAAAAIPFAGAREHAQWCNGMHRLVAHLRPPRTEPCDDLSLAAIRGWMENSVKLSERIEQLQAEVERASEREATLRREMQAGAPKIEELFRIELHECSAQGTARIRGVLYGWYIAGLISDTVMDGWLALTEKCPGHEGGQTWCAYCGDLQDEPDWRDGELPQPPQSESGGAEP